MSEDWNNGYKAGYEEGYKTAVADIKTASSTPVKIQDPGCLDDFYEEAYGAAVYRKMKKEHDKH